MDYIATLQCQDQPGIVHAMTSSVLACGGNIIENQQFTDELTTTFVMRTRFETHYEIAEARKVLHDGLGNLILNFASVHIIKNCKRSFS